MIERHQTERRKYVCSTCGQVLQELMRFSEHGKWYWPTKIVCRNNCDSGMVYEKDVSNDVT